MRAISERDLAVVIPLLAAKIRDLTLELRAGQAREGEPTDEALSDHMQIQDMLGQYESILQALREEYEEGLKAGTQLPAFDDLVRPFRLRSP
ncbi:hypothetical protein ACFWZ3_15575 [Frateuria sp. GZRR35]|uniref:hypothetical protein n=1 Tax=unclassified Frateuria TaxID=2648894 RepID=UPI003EDC066A